MNKQALIEFVLNAIDDEKSDIEICLRYGEREEAKKVAEMFADITNQSVESIERGGARWFSVGEVDAKFRLTAYYHNIFKKKEKNIGLSLHHFRAW